MFLRQSVFTRLNLLIVAFVAVIITIVSPTFVYAADYNYVDEATISGPGGNFILDPDGAAGAGYYLNDSRCYDVISNISARSPGASTVTATLSTYSDSRGSGRCERVDENNIEIGNLVAATQPPGAGSGETTVPSCESQGGGLGWIACDIIEGMLGALQGITTFMSDLLDLRPLSSQDIVFSVWSNFRNIALAMMVIFVLISIFGQAIGIDAYTVKKMIPRVGVAAIAIMLSFYISSLLIDFFNVVGRGIQGLMLSTLGDNPISVGFGSEVAAGLLTGLGVGGAVVLALNPATLATIGLILLPVVLAFVTAIAVVILRHIIIIVLVIVSPLAFAAWILPNTDKWFKRWWGIFSTMLMMYPIIMMLLGAGAMYAVIITNGGGLTSGGTINSSNFVNYLLALVGIGVSMAAIPFTIRASSGVLSRLVGAINDPNRGLIDRTRKGLEARRDFNKDALRSERLNKLGQLDKGKGNRLKRGFYKATTGTLGYERYRDLQEAEAVTGARTVEERKNIAQEKAKRERGAIADYNLQQKTKSWAANEHMSQREITSKVENEIASITNPNGERNNVTDVERSAALRYLTTLRAGEELGRVMETAASGRDSDRALIEEFKQDNFGSIDGFAAHLSRSGYAQVTNPSTGETSIQFRRGYAALGELSPEQLASQKPAGLRGAFAHSAQLIEQGTQQLKSSDPEVVRQGQQNIDSGRTLANKLLTTYSNTAPHQRTAEHMKLFSEAASGFVDVGKGRHVAIEGIDDSVVENFVNTTGAKILKSPHANSELVTASSVAETKTPPPPSNQNQPKTPGSATIHSPAPQPSGSVQSRIEAVSSSAEPQAQTTPVQEVNWNLTDKSYFELENDLGGAPTTAEIAQKTNQPAPTSQTRYDYVHERLSNELGRRPTSNEMADRFEEVAKDFKGDQPTSTPSESTLNKLRSERRGVFGDNYKNQTVESSSEPGDTFAPDGADNDEDNNS